MAVSKRLRYEILRRDNHACRYCGATAPTVKLNVDHVIPVSLGGSDAPTNLVAACADCNGGKTSSLPNATPVDGVQQDTFHQAAELRKAAEQKRLATFVHLYMVWMWAWEKTGLPVGELDEHYFTEETYKLLACGWSGRAELTEAAFCAGSENAVDIASYIGRVMRASSSSLSTADERLVACVDAVRAWESAWDMARADDEAPPAEEVVVLFNAEVAAAFDAGAHPLLLARAAEAAGLSLSAGLGENLSQMTSAGGEF
ncbi:HNH endonuclease [Streptomyces sp. NPDC059171]|uniref:HNH endonuclease n=1 Tax=Streptomyces sp. NPDC059171 TaxID=3346755 RepID=UPI0036B0197E